MRDRAEMKPLGDVLGGLLSKLGVSDLTKWEHLRDDWGDIVAEPWKSQARPITIRGNTLVVEAISTTSVSLLKYGVSSLVEALGRDLGEGVVTEVVVRNPKR